MKIFSRRFTPTRSASSMSSPNSVGLIVKCTWASVEFVSLFFQRDSAQAHLVIVPKYVPAGATGGGVKPPTWVFPNFEKSTAISFLHYRTLSRGERGCRASLYRGQGPRIRLRVPHCAYRGQGPRISHPTSRGRP